MATLCAVSMQTCVCFLRAYVQTFTEDVCVNWCSGVCVPAGSVRAHGLCMCHGADGEGGGV